MEIQKTSVKYNLYREGADYILDLGTIKRGENTETVLLINQIEDSSLLTIHPQCGCTASEVKRIDQNSLSVNLTYKNCDPSFVKVVEIKYRNVKIGIIKIKGKCS